MVAGRQGIKYIYSITVCARGQDAASIGHHCANTNVAGNFTDMTYDPPIEKRTTDQLMEIVESPDDWKPDLGTCVRVMTYVCTSADKKIPPRPPRIKILPCCLSF
jgi:hypothetical protein